ncbi:MAG: hypothetical protein ACJAZ3_000820 [Sphingobacteriales bacterium]|jgi:hypothetical protein
MTNKTEKEFKPLHAYLLILSGSFLIIVRFFGGSEDLTTLDIFKFVFGALIIGFGVFKLMKLKK